MGFDPPNLKRLVRRCETTIFKVDYRYRLDRGTKLLRREFCSNCCEQVLPEIFHESLYFYSTLILLKTADDHGLMSDLHQQFHFVFKTLLLLWPTLANSAESD